MSKTGRRRQQSNMLNRKATNESDRHARQAAAKAGTVQQWSDVRPAPHKALASGWVHTTPVASRRPIVVVKMSKCLNAHITTEQDFV